jgi:hypothetical protein
MNGGTRERCVAVLVLGCVARCSWVAHATVQRRGVHGKRQRCTRRGGGARGCSASCCGFSVGRVRQDPAHAHQSCRCASPIASRCRVTEAAQSRGLGCWGAAVRRVVERSRWHRAVALVWVGAWLAACAGRKTPAGPPPEYERTELPAWPPASASAQNGPGPASLGQTNGPPEPAPSAAPSGAPQAPVLSDPTSEAIDPAAGSR